MTYSCVLEQCETGVKSQRDILKQSRVLFCLVWMLEYVQKYPLALLCFNFFHYNLHLFVVLFVGLFLECFGLKLKHKISEIGRRGVRRSELLPEQGSTYRHMRIRVSLRIETTTSVNLADYRRKEFRPLAAILCFCCLHEQSLKTNFYLMILSKYFVTI